MTDEEPPARQWQTGWMGMGHEMQITDNSSENIFRYKFNGRTDNNSEEPFVTAKAIVGLGYRNE